MNIIYLSGHGILEYDEVKLLTEMGHSVFCVGDYGGNERPLISGRDRTCKWLTQAEGQQICSNGQGNLPDFAIERCDVIVAMHFSGWLTQQWERIKKKKCYLRLIGQHVTGLGSSLKPFTDQGLKVIPYWPSDLELNGLAHSQTTEVIRFYKDENEFQGWTGTRRMILTACNDIMRGGGRACHAEAYKLATSDLPRLLVGKENRFFGDFTARVPYWMLKELMQQCKVYFYVGTEPATYTLNLIEAMMTDIPIVAYDTGAAKEIVHLASADPSALNDILTELLDAKPTELAKYRCRNKAIGLFGKQQAIVGWKKIL